MTENGLNTSTQSDQGLRFPHEDTHNAPIEASDQAAHMRRLI